MDIRNKDDITVICALLGVENKPGTAISYFPRTEHPSKTEYDCVTVTPRDAMPVAILNDFGGTRVELTRYGNEGNTSSIERYAADDDGAFKATATIIVVGPQKTHRHKEDIAFGNGDVAAAALKLRAAQVMEIVNGRRVSAREAAKLES